MDIMNEIVTKGNTDYNKFLEELIKNGMDKKWARMFVKKFADDELLFPTEDSVCELMMKNGFFPGRKTLYGITEENEGGVLCRSNFYAPPCCWAKAPLKN